MERIKLEALLESMSLEEKIDQMLQVSGNLLMGNQSAVITGPLQESGLTEENLAQAGSVIGLDDPTVIMEVQKRAMQRQKHGIPLLFMLDVINGFKTVFPIPLAQGATFDLALIERCAAIAAKEAAVSGIHISFAPMVDLVRDARWGRVMESPGEDPYLNSLFAKAVVNGFQSKDIGKPDQIAACIKHFAGYGAPVAGRDYNTVEVSDHTLRQMMIPAYQAGIEAGSALVMTAFNTLNGIPATGNQSLMQGLLRNELGFDGVLISDWAAIEELIAHGYAENKADAAKKALDATVDIDMMTGIYSGHLKTLVQEGKVQESQIDEAVWRILTLKNNLGLFENPWKDADPLRAKELLLCPEHRSLAKEAACKSFVLLENEGILPLSKQQRIAFIGPYVFSKEVMGSWSIASGVEAAVSLHQAAQEQLSSSKVTYHQGCAMVDEETVLEAFSNGGSAAVNLYRFSEQEEKQQLEMALNAARNADVVVLALGEHYLQSGEACSKAEIMIPEVQQALLEQVTAVNPNVVVVLFNGRPLDLRKVRKHAKAILEVWMPGTEAGHAIMDVLFAKISPSGKLSMSFPYSVGQVPVYYNEDKTGRPHILGKDKDKFRSKYLDIPNAPLYCFGYGLTYSRFELFDFYLSKNKMTAAESIEAFVTLKNVGNFEATETVQLYLQDVSASVVRPIKELKAFRKVTLKEKSQTKICFKITEEQLRFINEQGNLVSEPGHFLVFIGLSSATELQASFELL